METIESYEEIIANSSDLTSNNGNSLGNSLGVISRNENRHAKITSRKCLCLNSVLPCVNSRGILSMCFLFVGKLYM